MADAELTVRISGDTGDLESAIGRVESQLSRLERSGGSNVGAGMERNFKTAADRLEQTAKQWKNLGEGVDTLTKPFQVAGVVMAAGAVASAKFAIDFENNFANVRKTVDGTDEQLNKIKQDIIDMTTVGINGHSAIPQTTAELTELAAAGGQLGIQTENISSFTETMAMMGSATNLAGEEGAKTLARFMNVANVSQGEVQNLGSSIVDLGNHFATTEAEIAAMAQRMGATGTAVGISAQDILAYSTALSSLGVEAEAGGSSISRIWMDIQTQVSTGGELLGEFAKVSGKTTKEFAEGWKNDASGTFKDFVDGLSKSKDLVGTLKNLGFDNIRDLQALQKLAGPQGVQLLNDALQRSNNAWSENTALVNEFKNKAGTTASQIQVMKNNLVEAGRSLGETFLPTINNGVTDIKNFAQGISKMSDGQKQALITTGKWVIGLGAAGKATSGVTKRIGETTEAVAKIKKAFELGGTFASVTPVLTAAADAGLDLEGYGKILTDIAKAAGMIEENQTIKISADGDISVLEEVEDKANELNGKNVELTVNADGSEAYATIDGVQYKVAAYDGETGEAILTADGTKADMVINRTTGEVHLFSNEEGIATLSAIDNVTATAQQAAKSLAGVKSKTVTITAVYVNKRVDQFANLNGWATKQAKGTQDFKGGMAMINDQRGVSDPRELVEVNGKGYIFEGRDVVLPLPRHAKVYTAGQTKEMLAMAGLRRYARGKDNQEWENAQDDWAHYTKVNNVSAFEALEHWDEMMKKFSYDAEVVKDIQEEIVASTKDMWDEEMATMQFYLDMGIDSEEHYYKWLETYRDEHFEGNDEMWRKATLDITKYNKRVAKESAEALNDASEEYIRFHTIAGDWDEIDDSPLAAYARVLDRAEEDLANGVYESVEEKNEFLKNFGSNMFDAYKEDADNWIQHERDYNAMSTEDYISALNRKKQRTNEYFAQGIIDYQTYLKEVQDYNEKIMSAYADEVNQWRDDADFYQRQSEVYGWGFNGTGHKSTLKYWQARLDREIENSHDMNLSANERQSALRYADEARMEIYKARQDELDDELEKFRQSIEDTRIALDDEVQNMRDAWTTEDRKTDMSELAEQIAVFKYAQTKEGIDKYKSLNEEYTRLSREQKIEDIQAANSEKLDRMQAQYDKMEQDKIDELAGLKDELLKYGGIAVISDQTRQIAAAANDNISALVSNISDFGESFSSFAARLFEKLDERPTVINNYDNSTQNIANNIHDKADLQAAALGVGLGGLSMMLFGRRR